MFLFLCPRILQAQSDAKAREILDKTAAAFRQAQAVSITFGGTQEGTLLLKGNKFHLNTGDVETWFDGKPSGATSDRTRKSTSPLPPRKNCRASTHTYCWTITASITTAVTAECGHTAANRDRKSS